MMWQVAACPAEVIVHIVRPLEITTLAFLVHSHPRNALRLCNNSRQKALDSLVTRLHQPFLFSPLRCLAMNTASFVFSTASLAIQLAEIGDAVLGLSNYLSNKGPSSASLALAMSHEFEQTKRLERVLQVKGKFGLKGCLLDEMDDATRTLVLAMFHQLSEVWGEYIQLRDKYVLKDEPADLERGSRNDSGHSFGDGAIKVD